MQQSAPFKSVVESNHKVLLVKHYSFSLGIWPNRPVIMCLLHALELLIHSALFFACESPSPRILSMFNFSFRGFCNLFSPHRTPSLIVCQSRNSTWCLESPEWLAASIALSRGYLTNFLLASVRWDVPFWSLWVEALSIMSVGGRKRSHLLLHVRNTASHPSLFFCGIFLSSVLLSLHKAVEVNRE